MRKASRKGWRNIRLLGAGFLLFPHDKGVNLLQQVVALIVVDLQGNGLGQVQGKDAQDRLGVHNMAPCAQIHFKRIAGHDVHKVVDVLNQAQLNHSGFHGMAPPLPCASPAPPAGFYLILFCLRVQ